MRISKLVLLDETIEVGILPSQRERLVEANAHESLVGRVVERKKRVEGKKRKRNGHGSM